MRSAWAAAMVRWGLAAVVGTAAHAGAAADSSVSGLRLANQVVRDTAADSASGGETADPAEVAAALQSLPAVVDDISLFSSRTVTLHDLDLLVRNHRRSAVAVRVHDASGREVLSRDYGPGRAVVLVAMDKVPRGIYVCSVRVADSVYARTFVVTR